MILIIQFFPNSQTLVHYLDQHIQRLNDFLFDSIAKPFNGENFTTYSNEDLVPLIHRCVSFIGIQCNHRIYLGLEIRLNILLCAVQSLQSKYQISCNFHDNGSDEWRNEMTKSGFSLGEIFGNFLPNVVQQVARRDILPADPNENVAGRAMSSSAQKFVKAVTPFVRLYKHTFPHGNWQ